MNIERLEHELNNRKGAIVTVVRPGYGTQSESWIGILSVTHAGFPMIFQVVSERGATIFRGDDVISVEDTDNHDGEPKLLIRLKGPNDYRGKSIPVAV